MSEMVDRVAEWLGRTDVPHNRFTLRDALISLFIMADGPTAVQGAEKGADAWLKAFATEAIKGMREPTEAMIRAADGYEVGSPAVRAIWEDMITAALDS